MTTSIHRAEGTRATRRLVTRLAAVAVQGEHLQALCEELRPLVQRMQADPLLQPSAALLTSALESVGDVARDIALVTEALGAGLQPDAAPPRGAPQ